MLFVLLIQIILILLAVLLTLYVILKLNVELFKTNCTCTAKLDGKVVLITGGNAGIGFETAKRLAKHGARVVIASRNLRKSDAAAESIRYNTGNSEVCAKALDLSSLSDIKRFTEDFGRSYERLDILINNAGCNQWEHTFTEDGIEKVMQVNHVGPAYLTHLLLDKLIASKPSRIIFVSSGMYWFHMFNAKDIIGSEPHNVIIRYGTSKFCNILSVRALAMRLPEGVTANALHPGAAETDIWDCIPWKIPRKITCALLRCICKTAEECAQTTIHAALAPSLDTITGQFFEDCKLTKVYRLPASDKVSRQLWEETIKLSENKMLQRNNQDIM